MKSSKSSPIEVVDPVIKNPVPVASSTKSVTKDEKSEVKHLNDKQKQPYKDKPTAGSGIVDSKIMKAVLPPKLDEINPKQLNPSSNKNEAPLSQNKKDNQNKAAPPTVPNKPSSVPAVEVLENIPNIEQPDDANKDDFSSNEEEQNKKSMENEANDPNEQDNEDVKKPIEKDDGQYKQVDPAAVSKQLGSFPEERKVYPVSPISKEEEESHFFTYFSVLSILCLGTYVAYHNKQKILAMVLEGRRGSRRGSRGGRRRPSTANYRKLDSNLEEAVTSQCNANVTHVIY